MASEEQFLEYMTTKSQQWAWRVPEPNVGEQLKANYYIMAATNPTLVSDLRNDGQFFAREICAFVNNSRDEDVLRILAEVLGELDGVPYAGALRKPCSPPFGRPARRELHPGWIGILALGGIGAVGPIDHLSHHKHRR